MGGGGGGFGGGGKEHAATRTDSKYGAQLSGWDDFAILNAICAGLKVLLCV